MSLRPEELLQIATELSRELAGAVVQRVHAPTTSRVYLEVRRSNAATSAGMRPAAMRLSRIVGVGMRLM